MLVLGILNLSLLKVILKDMVALYWIIIGVVDIFFIMIITIAITIIIIIMIITIAIAIIIIIMIITKKIIKIIIIIELNFEFNNYKKCSIITDTKTNTQMHNTRSN